MDIQITFCGYNIKKLPEEALFLFKQRVVMHTAYDFLGKYNAYQEINNVKFLQKEHSYQKVEFVFFNVSNAQHVEQKLEELKKILMEDLKQLLHENLDIYKISIAIDNQTNGRGTSMKRSNNEEQSSVMNNTDFDFENIAAQYSAKEPLWKFDQIVLPESVFKEINIALNLFKYEPKVFDEWGLRSIEPFARSALNFYGPPGTGKTMAAHAIASKLKKKILVASYAQIESKYHGEGPKNVEAIFLAAQRDDSVLFIDEADSLLSKRLVNVTQGSEQAINSMRSQLLICLEKFTGIVIFATNLVKNYDYAFETRVKSINFVMPDLEARKKIWKVHLLSTIPLDKNVSADSLAANFDDFCGRDIKNAVINACITSAMNEQNTVTQQNFVDSCRSIIQAREQLHRAKDDTILNKEGLKDAVEATIKSHIEKEKAGVPA